MNGLGEFLRGEREKRHITIEQVASATKINVKLLHALENDNYDALPAKPFVRGFVTSYSRYVGLDSLEVLHKFDDYLDEKSGKKFERPASSPHIFVEREGQKDNSKTMLSIIMGVFLVVGVLVMAVVKPSLKHRKERARVERAKVSNETIVTVVPPPSEPSAEELAAKPSEPAVKPTKKEPEPPAPVVVKTETKPIMATPPPPPKVEAPKPTPKPVVEDKPEPKPEPKPVVAVEPPKPAPKPAEPPKAVEPSPAAADAKTKTTQASASQIPYPEVKHWLVVRAKEDSWVKYTSDGFPFKEFMLRKDKKIFIRARENIRFKTGNPNGLEISLDHKNFIPYGNGMKTLIVPAQAEAQFRDDPFQEGNPSAGN